MNRLIIALFIFMFSFSFTASSAAGSAVNNTPQTSYTQEETLIYVRVLIDGHWWTYIYELDGSFIVAIPDDDE